LAADYKSRSSSPIIYIPHLAMLKTTAEAYTRKVYSEFEEQFSFTCHLLQYVGAISMYMVTPTIIVFNSEDMTITCSCRKYECIGMCHILNYYYFTVHTAQTNCFYIVGILYRHALRVFNINEVFILPSHYILNRWTKYAKREFYCKKAQINTNETSKTQVACISRKVTSTALKCLAIKEILDNLERAIDNLDIQTDNSLSQRAAKQCMVPQSSNVHDLEILKG
jgi:hypothetical protein